MRNASRSLAVKFNINISYKVNALHARLNFLNKFRIEKGCQKETCKNGGTCIDLPAESSKGYQCRCQEPFLGKNCEQMFKGKLTAYFIRSKFL